MEKLMRNLILSTVSTLALLIYPLSVSAQSSFSLSLDVNSAAGDQSVMSLNTSADQVIAIQIFGTNIQNANALAVRFEYDASQVTYEGFDVGSVLPSAQALPEHGANPTFVEIGIASLGGQATVNSGLMGTIRFRATAAFSGATIQFVRAELSRGGRFETIAPNMRVELQTPPAPTNFSLSLDADDTAGDQSVTSLDVPADQVVGIQIFGKDIQNANGLSVRFEYDASQVTYDGFDAGSVLPNAQALPEQGTNPTFVQIGIVSFGSQATANSGLIGTVRFRTTAAFSGTAIRLARAELSRGGRFETVTPNIRIELQLHQVSTAPSPDFDGNGIVNIADFLAFVSHFGSSRGDGTYQAKYDLDSDGQIAISDFLSFVNDFGKEVPSSGGSGGGGSGNPDLIVESPSVSDSTLTAGQSFTLRATVRNQGSGQAAATTLRYYQSSDATITVNDTQVGTDAIGSLNASSTSAESISLNAPARAGTYYYGACVEQVSGEPEIDNNCSAAVRVSVSGGTGLVDIPDANLRAAIETALGKASGAPITPAEMATLTRLNAERKGISDLTGLEFATNLVRLELGPRLPWNSGGNAISNISPLSGLTNLEVLSLSDNAVSDISALSNLTNLTELSLYSNLISDVSALAGLTNLTHLLLYNNVISDISALAGLTNLKVLNLSRNLISDVSVLAGLTNLIDLRLHNNAISDVSVLAGLTNLTDLLLYNNVISDVSALAGLTNLTQLSLGDNVITEVSALANMTKLTRLSLDSNAISDVSALAGLTNLTHLALSDNVITEISALADMTHMEWLTLSYTLISDVSALSGMTSLTYLYLRGNTVASISPLAGLTRLKELVLWGSAISDVSALSGMTNLTLLSLYDNLISDISPLSGLNNLTILYLAENLISNISPLANLTKLTDLHLFTNIISDISPLANLTNLKELQLGDNTISDVSALSGLTRMETLWLVHNEISNISTLSGLTSLKTLKLYNNSISDLAPLVSNTGLGSGDEVDVRGNPLSVTSLNTHIPTLQGRGVDVSFGALKPAVAEKETRMPSKPVVKENERRMPRAAMKQFGVGEQEEAEYMSRRRMEMRLDVISRKASSRDKARREIRSTQKAGNPAGTSED